MDFVWTRLYLRPNSGWTRCSSYLECLYVCIMYSVCVCLVLHVDTICVGLGVRVYFTVA